MAWAALAVARLTGLGLASLFLLDGLARAGEGIIPWWGARRRGALPRFGLGLLLGWLAFGTAAFGLGLTGLFLPSLVTMAGLALVACSPAGRSARSPVLAALAAARSLGRWGAGALALGAAALVPYLLVPEFESDSEMYHLALPWQWLVAHRAIFDQVPVVFHLSLPVDLGFTAALVLGDDRIAKCMVAGALAAASAVWAGRELAAGRRWSAWIGPLLVMSSLPVAWLATTAKNDVPAAALLACGAILQLDGVWGLGAVFLGLGGAAKYSAAPLILFWCLAHPPPRRLLVRCAAGLVLPGLAWPVKAWLVTGNPVYPFAWRMFPGSGWGAANVTAQMQYASGFFEPGAERLATLPAACVRVLAQDHLPILLALPGLLLLTPRRKSTMAVVVGLVASLAAGRNGRYLMPAAWLLALLIAAAAETGPVSRRRVLGWVIAMAAFARLGTAAATRAAWWPEAGRPLTAVLERHLSTRGEAARDLASLGRAPFRVLNVGEFRSYRLPARSVAGGTLGETPLVWSLVRASRTPADLRVRFRQLGAGILLHNFISTDWLATRYQGFTWDRRMARLYAEFCRRYLMVAVPPATCDYANGGFYLYRILARPRSPVSATVFFLPGAESLQAEGIQYNDMSPDPPRALKANLDLLALLPDVGSAWNRVGHACLRMNDVAGALRYLTPFGEAGMLDGLNLADYAVALTTTHHLARADGIIDEAMRRCPNHRMSLRANRATWCKLSGQEAYVRGDTAGAAALLERGLAALAEVPDGADPANEPGRRHERVFLTGMLGQVRVAQGNRAEGIRLLREAERLDPGAPVAATWRRLVEQAAGPARLALP